ncbi:MAG: hypothetical protein ACRCXZ_06065 [Patescibacteria group bacterium]
MAKNYRNMGPIVINGVEYYSHVQGVRIHLNLREVNEKPTWVATNLSIPYPSVATSLISQYNMQVLLDQSVIDHFSQLIFGDQWVQDNHGFVDFMDGLYFSYPEDVDSKEFESETASQIIKREGDNGYHNSFNDVLAVILVNPEQNVGYLLPFIS